MQISAGLFGVRDEDGNFSQVCHTNTCPVGVATTDKKLQEALAIDEKKYRAANYLVTLRQDLFNLAAVAGLDSPTKFTREHIVYHSMFKEYVKREEKIES
ncbi:ferredoxin-dependent glutamate synthase [Gracilibacillus boraciitolerans JCM 21714]|uniref:Ferredoxin-dependent glutamate synthase n=1 Tax=Gracilibacillus boraciitolerans JCM 21714 TaxID=1298598 RepID=W4VM51_9BACI|nr:ferredoxin-dependent glutamate synthase [Gracilibacillus boraciitolerans JCM 21714]